MLVTTMIWETMTTQWVLVKAIEEALLRVPIPWRLEDTLVIMRHLEAMRPWTEAMDMAVTTATPDQSEDTVTDQLDEILGQ